MKMQLITIIHKKHGIDAGFKIKRELYDDCGLIDTAFCSVRYVERGFIASGFLAFTSLLLYMLYLMHMSLLMTL